MVKKYHVGLTEEQQEGLNALVSKGRAQPINRLTPAFCC